MDDQSRNLILATALSFLVILVWFLLFPPPDARAARRRPPPTEATGTAARAGGPARRRTGAPTLGRAGRRDARGGARPDAAACRSTPPRLAGSLSLIGGRIDDLELTDYRETIEPGLADRHPASRPAGAPRGLLRALRLGAGGRARPGRGAGPDDASGRSRAATSSTETTPVTLVWDNGAGLIFRQTISVDANYMFTVTQSVENTTGAEVRLAPYGIIARHGDAAGPEELLHPARGHDPRRRRRARGD